MIKSLYEVVDMKRKKSLLKSVFIPIIRTDEGYPIIEIEAYDDVFINATKNYSGQDKTSEYINQSIKKHAEAIKEYLGIKDEQFWIIDYSTFNRHREYILSL